MTAGDRALRRDDPPIRMIGDQFRPAEALEQLTAPDSEYVREPQLRGWTLADKGWFPFGAALIAWGRPGFEIAVIHGGHRERGAIDVSMCAPGEAEQIGVDPLSVAKLDPFELVRYLSRETDLPRNREWSHERHRWTFAQLLDNADQHCDELAAVFTSPERVSQTRAAMTKWSTASNRRFGSRLDERRSEMLAFLTLVQARGAPTTADGLRLAAGRVARSPEIAEWLVDFSLHQTHRPLVRKDGTASLKWRLSEDGERWLRNNSSWLTPLTARLTWLRRTRQ